MRVIRGGEVPDHLMEEHLLDPMIHEYRDAGEAIHILWNVQLLEQLGY